MSSLGFNAPLGGVMTLEEGAITGELILELTSGGDVRIAYAGSTDWLTVEGSPVAAGADPERLVAWLSRDPGLGTDDNPRSTDLRDLPAT